MDSLLLVVLSAGTMIGSSGTDRQHPVAAGATDTAEVFTGEEDATVAIVARSNRTIYLNKDCFRLILMYNFYSCQ